MLKRIFVQNIKSHCSALAHQLYFFYRYKFIFVEQTNPQNVGVVVGGFVGGVVGGVVVGVLVVGFVVGGVVAVGVVVGVVGCVVVGGG